MEIKRLIEDTLNIKINTIEPIHGGMMNKAFLINNEYIFYIPVDASNKLVNRQLENKVSNIFYNLGLASKIIYFDTNTGIKSKKFIHGTSLNHLNFFDIKEVAILFQSLHNSNLKCGVYYAPFEKLESFYNECHALNIKLSETFEDLYLLIKEKKSFLEDSERVLCHNDAQKSNIILGKDNSMYFIDFEFAMDNDPIYDYAAFGNDNVEDGFELLKESFKPCSITLQKRYYLWRIFISLQWHLVALIKNQNNEGLKLNINFLEVANHFINNALYAYNKYIIL